MRKTVGRVGMVLTSLPMTMTGLHNWARKWSFKILFIAVTGFPMIGFHN